MLIKTKINTEQIYVRITEPNFEEFLNAGKSYYIVKTKEKWILSFHAINILMIENISLAVWQASSFVIVFIG